MITSIQLGNIFVKELHNTCESLRRLWKIAWALLKQTNITTCTNTYSTILVLVYLNARDQQVARDMLLIVRGVMALGAIVTLSWAVRERKLIKTNVWIAIHKLIGSKKLSYLFTKLHPSICTRSISLRKWNMLISTWYLLEFPFSVRFD